MGVVEAYQKRVELEEIELGTKVQKLAAFITSNPEFAKLDVEDKELLRRQRDAMLDYHRILAQRIEKFPKEA